jgi:hypothetical protein
MLHDKIKLSFKRRRPNKIRYSAIKIFTGRAELKHTNNKVTILKHTYNKQKLFLERCIRKSVNLLIKKEIVVNEKDNEKDGVLENTKEIVFNEKDNQQYGVLENTKEIVFNEKDNEKDGVLEIKNYENKLVNTLKTRFYYDKIDVVNFIVVKTDNLFKKTSFKLKKKHLSLYNISLYNKVLLKNYFNYEKSIFYSIISTIFNVFKSNTTSLNYNNLGLFSLISEMYYKYPVLKIIELKSLHLNSDVFSSAVALKLRDRMNKAVNILRKATIQMVKIPFLHTLITFDSFIQSINKDNIVNVIKQQVVSGVRFEASGRLTRRLTAMRSIFKFRYLGSLKDLRSSLTNLSSTTVRG